MKFFSSFLLLSVITSVSQLSLAQNEVLKDLITTKSLVCEFPYGVTADWSNKSLKLENDKMSNSTNFDNIDLKARNARMIGTAGAENVLAFASPSGLMFIEGTGSGNTVYITIFPAYLEDRTVPTSSKNDVLINSQLPKAFLAVMSMHIFDQIRKQPMPGQFYGYCRKLS